MAFKNNARFGDDSHLYSTFNSATQVTLTGSGATTASMTGATSFKLKMSSHGTDKITGFSANDSIVVDHKLFDGNGDGYIDFGDNHRLDANRTQGGATHTGNYQVTVLGNGDNIGTIRLLGAKDGTHDYVYGAASTRDQLFGHFKTGMDNSHGLDLSTQYGSGDAAVASSTVRIEGTVGNDTFDAGNGSTTILFDNALGLNLGADTVNNFGSDDLLIFTAELQKNKSNDFVGFGDNKVLDLSSQAPDSRDGAGGPGGQLDVNGVNTDIQQLKYLGSETLGTGVSAVTYYFYGTSDHAALNLGGHTTT